MVRTPRAPKTDVVVVGAGLSGVLAARSLARDGHSVLVLDAGSRLRRPPADAAGFERAARPFLAIDDASARYENLGARYRWTRVRAVGGRTLSWGAWMDRPDADYFDARKRAGHAWPLGFEDLAPSLGRAERELCVRTGRLPPSLAPLRARGVDVTPKREAVLPRARRATTALDLVSGIRVLERATVLRVLSDNRGRVRCVEAIVDGTARRIAARAVVLAASPIESARILHHTPRAPSAGLGSRLHDHLVAGAIAIVRGVDVAERERGKPDHGGVILPRVNDAVRMTVEVRAAKKLSSLDDEDLATLSFDRKSARDHALCAVFALAETDPAAKRSVTFDDLRPDALGRALPILDVAGLTNTERATARALKQRVLEVAKLVGGQDAVAVYLVRDPRELGEVGHECGTCPMGAPGESVVDTRGAVHGMRGLFIADASPLPGALDRHPSLTLAAYALRTARFASKELDRG